MIEVFTWFELITILPPVIAALIPEVAVVLLIAVSSAPVVRPPVVSVVVPAPAATVPMVKVYAEPLPFVSTNWVPVASASKPVPLKPFTSPTMDNDVDPSVPDDARRPPTLLVTPAPSVAANVGVPTVLMAVPAWVDVIVMPEVVADAVVVAPRPRLPWIAAARPVSDELPAVI